MSKMNIKKSNWLKKRVRTKKALGVLGKYPRLVVFKSNKHFYSQLLDDNKSITICSSSSNDKNIVKNMKKGLSKTDVSREIGFDIAKKISDKKMKQVVFDRNGYPYHGRIKALADSARDAGLEF